jgi:integrase
MNPESGPEETQKHFAVETPKEIRRQNKLEKDKKKREKEFQQRELVKQINPELLLSHNYSPETHDIIKKVSGQIIIRQKKRKTKDLERIISRQEIISMIDKIPEDSGKFERKGMMYRALIAMLYLTAGRINEILTIRKNQLEYSTDKKTGLQYLVINNVPVLKRKEKVYRPFFLRRDFEEPFLKYILAWTKELTSDEALLFPLNASRAWQIVKKYTGGYNHYFRHVRNTDLVRYYGFSSHFLQKWNGWKDGKSADFYVNLVNEDLRDKVLSTEPGRSF